jgi:hypothetical protein
MGVFQSIFLNSLECPNGPGLAWVPSAGDR